LSSSNTVATLCVVELDSEQVMLESDDTVEIHSASAHDAEV